MAWWSSLSRLFARAPAALVPTAVRTQPPAPPGVPGADKQPEPELSPFDKLVAVTGLVVPAVSAPTRDEEALEAKIAQDVLEHFRKNRPAPSSLPAVALKVLGVVSEPEAGLGAVTKLIAQDPALSAGVLKVASSAAYSGAQEVTALRDAVTRLGATEVARIAGTVAARSLFQAQVRAEFQRFNSLFTQMFNESVVTARGAAWLALRVKGANADQCFLAGMLHEIGRTVALRSLASLTLGGLRIDEKSISIERILEAVHVEIGGEVHQEWNLPRFSTLVAMRHHDLGLPTDSEYRDVHLVRLASSMVQLRHHTWRFEAIRSEVNESAAALKLDAFVLRSFETELREEQAALQGSAPERKRAGAA